MSDPKACMSPANGTCFWTIVAMFAIIWGIPLALSAFGASSQLIFAVIAPLVNRPGIVGGPNS